MFSNARLLVLIGFIAPILVTHTQGQQPNGRNFPGVPRTQTCGAKFVPKAGGTFACGNDHTEYSCTNCPDNEGGTQNLVNCVPLTEVVPPFVIPANWKVPYNGKGALPGDKPCAHFSRLSRYGNRFGYGCYDPADGKLFVFCSDLSGSFKPRTCHSCLINNGAWVGDPQ